MLPQRMCVACRARGERNSLFRIVKPKDSAPGLDTVGNMMGRGAYVCKDSKCIETAQKRRALNRALRCEIDDSLYNQLHIIIDGGEQNGCQN